MVVRDEEERCQDVFEGPISASEVEKEPEKAVVENGIVFDSLALTFFLLFLTKHSSFAE